MRIRVKVINYLEKTPHHFSICEKGPSDRLLNKGMRFELRVLKKNWTLTKFTRCEFEVSRSSRLGTFLSFEFRVSSLGMEELDFR